MTRTLQKRHKGPGLLDDHVELHAFCDQLGISTRTADRWDILRTGPPRTRLGKKIYYKKTSVLEWLKRREQAAV